MTVIKFDLEKDKEKKINEAYEYTINTFGIFKFNNKVMFDI